MIKDDAGEKVVEGKKDEAKEKEVKPADKEVTEKAKENSDKGNSLKQNISEETMAQFSGTSKEVGRVKLFCGKLIIFSRGFC